MFSFVFMVFLFNFGRFIVVFSGLGVGGEVWGGLKFFIYARRVGVIRLRFGLLK